MLRRLGYVATALSIDATTSRTCRLRNATPQRLRELIDANLCALDDIIRFNERERFACTASAAASSRSARTP